MDFYVSDDSRVKIKESETKENFLDLARESKKLRNMKVTIIVIGALGTVTKGLVKGRGLRNKRTSGDLLRSARLLRIVLETWGDLLLL